MARYISCLDLPGIALGKANSNLQVSISRVLESCNLSIVYTSDDYLVAKEKPGQIGLSELTTIEILIQPPKPYSSQVQLNLVAKNDRLALQSNNHCKRIFDSVHQAILTGVAHP